MRYHQIYVTILYLLLHNPIMAREYNTARVLNSSEKANKKNANNIPAAWVPYLNPTYEEFWSEGNHRPDAGFTMFARDPTPENARLWLIRMETKAKLLGKMQAVVDREYAKLIQQGVIEDRYGIVKSSAKISSTDKINVSLNQTTIDLIFTPSCSFCSKQAGILRRLNAKVIPKQVGGDKLKHFEKFPTSTWATTDEIEKYAQGGQVPVLVIHDSQTQEIALLQGVQDENKIKRAVLALKHVQSHS